MSRLMKGAATAVFGMLLSVAGSASPQDTTPALVSIRMVDVVPGKAQQYEAVLAKFREAVKKVDPDQGFGVRVPAVGGSGSGYYIYRFLEKASDLRQRNVLVEAFGQEEAAAIGAMLDEAVENTRVETFIPREDLSRRTELGDFEVVYVIRVEVAIGGAPAFEDYMHKLVEATDKVDKDSNWFGYSPGIGAGTTYRFAVPMNWADLDNPGMTISQRLEKAFGEKEAANILASRDAVVTQVETGLTVGRPDLSLEPGGD